MSPSKKKGTDSQSVEKSPGAKAINSGWKWSWGRFIIASVVIALIAVIISVFYYQNNVAPFRRTILTVDDITIDMGYFIKRARLAGVDPMTMLTLLTNEQLIKLAAPKYVGEVSAEDITQGLRITASGGSGNISESEFKEWYRQQLNETGFSDAEYKEIIRTSLLAVRLHEYLAERMPTVAEQIHLHAIYWKHTRLPRRQGQDGKRGKTSLTLPGKYHWTSNLKKTGETWAGLLRVSTI